MGGQEPGPEGGSADVVEAGFDVEEQRAGLEPGSLEGSDSMGEGVEGVGEVEAREGAASVRMKQALRSGDGG